MPKFIKEILKPGEYVSPDGEIIITPERISHWVNNFKKMKNNGLKIPLPWGHLSKAQPVTYEEKEFSESKYNAGFVESMDQASDGALTMTVDVPRDEDADRVGTIVQEVSPQIETAFRDGKGRIWTDVITHVALVTQPVVPGQSNFEKIEESPKPAYAMRLSLSKLKKDNKDDNMPDDKKKDDVKKDDSKVVDEAKTDDKKTDDKKTDDKKSTETKKETKKGGSMGNSTELLDLLAEVGLVLPDDIEVPEGPFADCLKTAALTMKNKLEELDTDDDSLKDLELPLEDELGKEGTKPNDATAANATAGMEAPKEEQPAMTMNLTKKDTPATKTNDDKVQIRLSLAEKKLEEADRKNMLADIELLLRSGRITPVVANKLKGDVKKYRLSLNSEDENAEVAPAVAMIETFKLLPEGHAWTSDEKVRMRAITEEALPSEFSQMNDEEAEKLADIQYPKKRVVLS